MRDLLERVKAATGPDRELDAEIEVAARWLEAARIGIKPEYRAPWRANRAGMVGDGHIDYLAPTFTASLDAALALVERVLPVCGWAVGKSPSGIGWARCIKPYQAEFYCEAPTSPLALLTALLTAKIEEGAGE